MIRRMRESARQPVTPPRLHVVLEPRAGHSLQELLMALEHVGATEIDLISAEFISAEIPPDAMPSLEPLAYVEMKKAHGPA